ncbi:MAG: hypothetical protein MJ100_06145 [Ruminococcus sp.]|nr:hypothetical protein [Ruminococcus sp.]
MKVKYGIITVLCLCACVLFGWLAMQKFQFGFVLASVLFLLTAVFWFIRLLKRNDESKPRNKAVLATIFLALSCIAALLSQFVNAVVVYRPMFVYDEYYKDRFCTYGVFPKELPNDADDVQFRVLGEGMVGSPCYMLSFHTADTAELVQQAEAAGAVPTTAALTDKIPADITPDWMAGDAILQCTVYRMETNDARLYVNENQSYVCCVYCS